MINAVNERVQVDFGLDSVTIQKFIAGIKGGRALTIDPTYPKDVVLAGHVIITDGNGTYKPMPLSQKTETSGNETVPVTDADGNPVYEYGSLPSGYAYAGILYRSISTKKPAASIMTNGQVNSVCVPFAMTSIMSAFKAACPLIEFIKDEEAQ